MTNDEIHQADELRDEKNEGEYGETQQGVRGYFTANVLIEKAHLGDREILAWVDGAGTGCNRRDVPRRDKVRPSVGIATETETTNNGKARAGGLKTAVTKTAIPRWARRGEDRGVPLARSFGRLH
jgi:hypothetical protein